MEFRNQMPKDKKDDGFEIVADLCVPIKDGKPVIPVFLDCPNCGANMRRRAGNGYRCHHCGGFTKLEAAKPKKRKRKVSGIPK